MNLTRKQIAFCEAYIETGNGTEAAKKAGYSERSAGQISDQNLKKHEIQAYIKERTAEMDAQRIASADEVMRFYSSVMRGEVKDAFGLDVSVADRLKAADSLMKRFAVAAKNTGNELSKLDKLLEGITHAAQS